MDQNGVLPVSFLTTIDEQSVVLPDTLYKIGPIAYGVTTQINAELIRKMIPIVSSRDIRQSLMTHIHAMGFTPEQEEEYLSLLQRHERWGDLSEGERENLLNEDARVLGIDRTDSNQEQSLLLLPASMLVDPLPLPSDRLLPHEQTQLEHLERIAPTRSQEHAELVARFYEYSRAYSLRVIMYALRGIESDVLPWETDSRGYLKQEVAEFIPPADMALIQGVGENYLALSAEIKKNSALQSI